MKKVGLFFNQAAPNNGPGKLAVNLVKGLEEIGADFQINKVGEMNGCLQLSPHLNTLPPSTLVGPNIMVLPTDMPNVWAKYANYTVPSKWSRDFYLSHDVVGECDIDIWPVGVDTEIFNVEKKNIKRDCFIYFKNRSQEELQDLKEFLNTKKISFDVLQYGQYTEEKLLNFAEESRFCILLTRTESQGIAYMEILSTNTPCYVLNKDVWDDRGADHACPASSVPYFDETCGVIAERYEKFDYFVDKLASFEPRNYILGNHTLAKSAQNYLELLEKSHAV